MSFNEGQTQLLYSGRDRTRFYFWQDETDKLLIITDRCNMETLDGRAGLEEEAPASEESEDMAISPSSRGTSAETGKTGTWKLVAEEAGDWTVGEHTGEIKTDSTEVDGIVTGIDGTGVDTEVETMGVDDVHEATCNEDGRGSVKDIRRTRVPLATDGKSLKKQGRMDSTTPKERNAETTSASDTSNGRSWT